jgi:chorismate synthase
MRQRRECRLSRPSYGAFVPPLQSRAMIAVHSDDAGHAAALRALDPRRWGCSPLPGGWEAALPGIGGVRIARLGWPQAQCVAAPGDPEPIDALAFLAQLQGEVWGMPPSEWVPANFLAVLADTGGSVLAAYRIDAGWTPAGWLGFAIAAGGRDGVAVSHMLGIREDARGGHDLGWLLKAVQAHEAVAAGHHAMVWTFDPLRGANARLNVEKLGATISTLTIDKYGPLRSALYGDVPSDRFTAVWDLLSPRTHERLEAVFSGEYAGPDREMVAALPEATAENADALAHSGAPALRYAIPGDVDRLQREEPARAVAWRSAMRRALSPLMTTARAEPGASRSDPAGVVVHERRGRYRVTGFLSVVEPDGGRRNEYVLTLDADGSSATSKEGPA